VVRTTSKGHLDSKGQPGPGPTGLHARLG
jgi:hypothetical protein